MSYLLLIQLSCPYPQTTQSREFSFYLNFLLKLVWDDFYNKIPKPVNKKLVDPKFKSAYEACFIYELRLRKMKVESQKVLPVVYKDVMLDCGYRAHIIVEDEVIVEIKSVANIVAIHEAQMLSYLKLSECKYGLLINFNVKLLKEGIRRFRM